MTANELRIGNYLLRDGVVVKADGRTIFDAWAADQLSDFGYDAIEITEEWLLKFGFKRQNNAWNEPKCAFEYLSGFSIWNPPGSDTYSLNDTVMCPKIEFVHQLQNLFFCLTGKEL